MPSSGARKLATRLTLLVVVGFQTVHVMEFQSPFADFQESQKWYFHNEADAVDNSNEIDIETKDVAEEKSMEASDVLGVAEPDQDSFLISISDNDITTKQASAQEITTPIGNTILEDRESKSIGNVDYNEGSSEAPEIVPPTEAPSRKLQGSVSVNNTAQSEQPQPSAKKRTNRKRVKPVPPPKNFTHFLSHIPKSGTSYAFGTLNSLLWSDPTYEALPATNTKNYANKTFDKFRGCNEGTNKVSGFAGWRYGHKGKFCNLWMSEDSYSPLPDQSYVVVRSPREHVLSMYFHCAESKDHASKAHSMPKNITVWLESWVNALHNESWVEWNSHFFCYDPRDSQSRWLDFDPVLGKEDLRDKWKIVGDNEQMDLSICLIYVQWTGWIAPQCNCTDDSGSTSSTNSTSSVIGPYNENNHAHGVKHHGATYLTDSHQDALIEALRKKDAALYKMTKEIMIEQVEEVERQHGVQLCRKIKHLGLP